MLTPEEIDRLIETMQPFVDQLNIYITNDMIRRIMARLKSGVFQLSASDIWAVQVLDETNAHFEAVQAEIKRWTGKVEKEIVQIFEDTGITAWDADRKIYDAEGKKTVPIYEMPRMVQIMEDTMQRTFGTLHNFTRTTAHASQQRFRQLLDTAHLEVMSGAVSYQEAYREAIDQLCTTQLKIAYGGAPGTPSVYHRDTIETAVLRVVRTGTTQTAGNISLQGMIDMDWDVIQVSGHFGARIGDGGENPGNHYWWQAKLYSRTGRTKGLPNFDVCGYGTGEGLCGWNCRHSFGPGIKGHNVYEHFDKEKNEDIYKLSQKQRELERSIRKLKYEVAGRDEAYKDCPESEKEQYKSDLDVSVAKLKNKVAAYRKFCADNELKPSWTRLEVAKYTRVARRKS